MMPNTPNRIRLRITGRVQGVGFRWFVFAEAKRRALSGWVRNNADGTVELEASGNPEDLSALRTHVGRGPPASRVDQVSELPVGSAELPASFRMH
jgi:acylphosphatase